MRGKRQTIRLTDISLLLITKLSISTCKKSCKTLFKKCSFFTPGHDDNTQGKLSYKKKESFPKLWILKVKFPQIIRPIKRLLPKVIPEFCEFILKEQIVLKISGVLSQTSFASFASFVTFDKIEDWNLWLIYGHWRWRVLGEEKDKKEEKILEGEHLPKC